MPAHKYLNPITGELEDILTLAPGNYDADSLSIQSGLECKDPSLTKQSDADQADINTIVRNFGLTGTIPIITLPPTIEEFSEIFDFQTAMNVMARANEAFLALPAEARARFNNNPHQFVNFIDEMMNTDNPKLQERRLAELQELGLATPQPATEKAAAPTPTPSATTAPTTTSTDHKAS